MRELEIQRNSYLANIQTRSQIEVLKLHAEICKCLDMLDNYGKKIENLAAYTENWMDDLKEYPLNEITEAFKVWRITNTKIPTPSEIIRTLQQQKGGLIGGSSPPNISRLTRSEYLKLYGLTEEGE